MDVALKPILYSLQSSNLENILYTLFLFIHPLLTDLTCLVPILKLSKVLKTLFSASSFILPMYQYLIYNY